MHDQSGKTKLSPFSPGDDSNDDYDDDFSVMDEDDIDLDVDFTHLGSKEELDAETEDEDHYDDGDSDVGTSFLHGKSDFSMHNALDILSNNIQHHHLQESIILPEDSKLTMTPYTRRECEDEGEGLRGIEGSKLAPMVRVRASIGSFIGIGIGIKNNSNNNSNNDMKSNMQKRSSMYLGLGTKSTSLDRTSGIGSCCDSYETGGARGGKESAITFGPGASQQHPWTLRKDSGINSRLIDGSRGDEIYYIGVIDILQQYNMRKRAETFVKVNDIYFIIAFLRCTIIDFIINLIIDSIIDSIIVDYASTSHLITCCYLLRTVVRREGGILTISFLTILLLILFFLIIHCIVYLFFVFQCYYFSHFSHLFLSFFCLLLIFLYLLTFIFLSSSQSISNDSKQISSVDSTTYAKRFIKFMDENID